MNYQNGDDDAENPGDGKGMFNAMISTKDFTDVVLFQIGFENFFNRHNLINQQILQMRFEGYSLTEIAQTTGLSTHGISRKLHDMEVDFLFYFQMPEEWA